MGNLNLYPNPVNGSQIHLDLKAALQKPEQIQLYSLEGRRIETDYHSGNAFIQLAENLASGTYFLLLRFPDGQVIRKKINVQ